MEGQVRPGTDAIPDRMPCNGDMNDSLRASDRDRDEVAGVLREQYAQGRLTMAEFDERSSAAYAARTVGELTELTADLPAQAESAPVSPVSSAWSPAAMRWIGIAAMVAVVAVVAGIAAGHVFAGWPVWIVVIVAIKLTHRGRHGGYDTRRRPPARRD